MITDNVVLKMEIKRRTFINLALATLGLTSLSCTAPRFVRLGAGTPGGAYFVCAGAISTLLESAGMNPRVQTTGGGPQNAILLDRAELDIGIINNIDAFQAMYEDRRENIRSVLPIFNGIHHFVVRADQPIYTLSDLDLQPFGLSNRGSTHDIAGRQIFEILNINPRFQNAGKGDTNNMVRDGLLKGFFATSGIPMPSISELKTSLDLRFLEFSDEEYLLVKEGAPWLLENALEAGPYTGMDKPLRSFSSWNALMANKDVDDELIYDIANVCYSNPDTIERAYQASDIDPNLIETLVLPLHPGAEEYYREKGIEIPQRLAS